jgi:RimJ/RimL family protein N-acetyltransferase
MFGYPLGDGAALSTLEPWHAEPFLAAVDRSREHLRPAVPVAHTVHTLEDSRRYLQKFADWHAQDTGHIFGIWLGDTPGDTLAGVVQAFDFDTTHLTCEVGTWIAADVEGRGLVTPACRFVVDWAIRRRGMLRVQWSNDPENVRSAAVARRLGMTREGVQRSSFTLGGRRWDNEVWSVLAAEWPTPH